MTPEQPLRGNVILIVEDDVETLTALAQLIANGLGCRVLTALSGYEALDVIDSGVRSTWCSQTSSCPKWTA